MWKHMTRAVSVTQVKRPVTGVISKTRLGHFYQCWCFHVFLFSVWWYLYTFSVQ